MRGIRHTVVAVHKRIIFENTTRRWIVVKLPSKNTIKEEVACGLSGNAESLAVCEDEEDIDGDTCIM